MWKTFNEYADFEDIKSMLLDILDPEDVIEDIMSHRITDFKNRDQILTSPGLADIINKKNNRGAIVRAVNNDTTTVGNLLSMLTDE